MQLTIKQWQTPCREQTTRVFTQFDPFTCHGCAKHTRSRDDSLISCAKGEQHVQLCSTCWDKEDWICSHCHFQPDDSDVLGCERCGQWAHMGCQIKDMSSGDNYICNACVQTDVDVISEMKIEAYDLSKTLTISQKQLKTTTDQCSTLTELKDKLTVELKTVQTTVVQQNQQLVNARAARAKSIAELKHARDTLQQVHGHCAKKMQQFQLTVNAKFNAGEQELVALKAKNKRLNKERNDCLASNARLKKNLQAEQLSKIKLLERVKMTNKRARSIYENNRLMECDIKKRRVRIPWKTSMPIRLKADGHSALWTKYKCAWREIFGEIEFLANLPKGVATYTSIQTFINDISR